MRSENGGGVGGVRGGWVALEGTESCSRGLAGLLGPGLVLGRIFERLLRGLGCAIGSIVGWGETSAEMTCASASSTPSSSMPETSEEVVTTERYESRIFERVDEVDMDMMVARESRSKR